LASDACVPREVSGPEELRFAEPVLAGDKPFLPTRHPRDAARGFVADFDVVVIGGGHNGLVTAGYLAKAGARVIVLEKRPLVGGACVTESPWPGFRINTFAYVCGLIRPQIVEDLQLTKFGYEPILFDPQYFVPFPSGKSLTMWVDEDKTATEVAKFSKADGKAFPKYIAFWNEVLELVEPTMMAPPVPIADLFGMFVGPEAERLLRELFLMSARDFLDEWFESEAVKAALATSAIIGTFLGPYSPGTAYVLGHHSIGTLDGHRGVWGFSKGGMGRIADAMAKAAEHFGALVRTNAGVKRILVERGRTVGVETEAGETIRAKAVASSIDAKQTFFGLVPQDSVETGFLDRVKQIRTRGASIKFNAALDGLPDYTAKPGAPGPQHRGSVYIMPSMEYAERAYDEAKYGAFSSHPFIDSVFQSVVDPTVAPPGKHTMTCFVQYAATELKGTTWDAFKPKAGEIVLDTIEEYAPNIRKVVKHWQVVSPADLERTLGATGGSVFQGDMTPDQIFSFRPMPGWANYRMPVGGLYMCGAGTHPGGGVLGAPGFNAAQVILEDLRSSPGRAVSSP
jgi:phytoene dehydrogenase-like protein